MSTDLEIHLRVPVAVVEDDDVCGVEVDAEAARPRAQHEDELGAALGVVLLDLAVSVLVRGLAVNPAVRAV